jgi:sugar phosphate isomerase/epimerase
MKRWQYKRLFNNLNFQEYYAKMDELGYEGWELVQFITRIDGEVEYAIFKREYEL